MGLYKGVGIGFLRTFVHAHGAAIEYQFIQKLNPEQREVYLHTKAGKWISDQLAAQLYSQAAAHLYPGDPMGLQHLGKERAKYNITGVYRSILKMATQSFIVKQAAKLWRVAYNTGEAHAVLNTKKNEALFIVRGYPEMPEILREVGCGYIAGVVEFTQVRNVRVNRDDLNPAEWHWIISWD